MRRFEGTRSRPDCRSLYTTILCRRDCSTGGVLRQGITDPTRKAQERRRAAAGQGGARASSGWDANYLAERLFTENLEGGFAPSSDWHHLRGGLPFPYWVSVPPKGGRRTEGAEVA